MGGFFGTKQMHKIVVIGTLQREQLTKQLPGVCFRSLISGQHDCHIQFHPISSERSSTELRENFQKEFFMQTDQEYYLKSVRRHARRNPSLLKNRTVVIKR